MASGLATYIVCITSGAAVTFQVGRTISILVVGANQVEKHALPSGCDLIVSREKHVIRARAAELTGLKAKSVVEQLPLRSQVEDVALVSLIGRTVVSGVVGRACLCANKVTVVLVPAIRV